jgi:serine/threonine-protein kinase RsbT
VSARALEASIDIRGEPDIVTARQTARATAERMGFGTIDQSRIATAVSELARNVVRYATDGRGQVHIRDVLTETRVEGIEIVVEDDGPGMTDPEEALSEGFTTGRGMGLGLPGTRRFMDEMILESEPGRGTTVTIRKWKR